jgi:transposase-like protein
MSSTANQPNSNPPCPHCNARSWRAGFKGGKQAYQCSQCRRHFRFLHRINNHPPRPPCPSCRLRTQRRGTYRGSTRFFCPRCRSYFRQLADGTLVVPKKRHPETNPLCPGCQGVTKKVGFRSSGAQRYFCKACRKSFVLEAVLRQPIKSNPPCPHCNGHSWRNGSKDGKQEYQCRQCQRFFGFSPQQQRQYAAQRQAEQLPALIEQKLPRNLPVEIREELQQELVVAALAGDFELSELEAAVARFRRKVNRESLTGFGYVSLDAVIPQTNGLTYADTLAG